MAFSDEGLGGLSRTYHGLYRKNLIPRSLEDKKPPILINTWEAVYFDVNETVVAEIAEEARKLDLELLVIDDGWLGTASTGTAARDGTQVCIGCIPGYG